MNREQAGEAIEQLFLGEDAVVFENYDRIQIDGVFTLDKLQRLTKIMTDYFTKNNKCPF